MGFLFGKPPQSKSATAVSGMQVQSSAYGKAVPLLFGTNKIAPNLIWYGDFTATAQSQSGAAGKGGVSGGGGGKGGGGSTSYLYSAAVAMAVGAGPIVGYGTVWKDKNITTTAALGMSTFLGGYPQTPWGYLLTNHGQTTVNVKVPAIAPYTVTVCSAAEFIADNGVVGPPAVANYTLVASAPAAGQYSVSSREWSGSVDYSFNAADAGKQVVISYLDGYNRLQQETAIIPTAYPYTITIYSQFTSSFSKGGVTATNIGYIPTGGTPAATQYKASGGVYTFNAAQAGATVTINYAAFNQSEPFQALGYTGLAYVAVANYQLGTSPHLSNHNLEVFGVYSNSVAGQKDADPSLVVAYLLTDPYNGAGFPSSRLGDLSNYQNYCLASNLLISPFYDQQQQAASMLTEIAVATNSEFVWANGVLTLVPYGDQIVTANGKTYTPPSAPLYDLTDSDFIYADGSDPVQLSVRAQSDAINSVKIEIANRAIQYNPDPVEAKDQAAIDMFGLRQNSATQAHIFADKGMATTSAQLQLQRQQIYNTYSFTVDQRYIRLDPMDLVTLTDSKMGLVRQWVRIKEIKENDDGTLSMLAEEYMQGTGSAATYSYQTAGGFLANYNASPGNVNPPMFLEPTAQLAEALEVWCAASGGPLWGGCDVYVSNDNQTYANLGRINGPARMGLLSNSLATITPAPTGQTIDSTNTLAVDITQSRAQLLSGTQQEALNYSTLCYVDGEYLSYQTAQLTAAGKYNLSYLVRGAYASPIGAHAAGTNFIRLDDGIFRIPFTQDKIGQTIFIKFLSFNLYGGGIQSLSDVTPASYTFKGTAYSSPLPDVTNVRALYVANIAQISWDEVEDFRPVQYEIRKGPSWAGAQIVGRFAHPPFNLLGNDTYWVAAVSQPVPGLTVYSPNPQSISLQGAAIVSNVIATWDEQATGWTGTLGGTARVIGSTVRTSGLGDILSITDVLTTADLLNYGGQGDGTYTIPVGHRINIGRVAPCNILIGWTAYGQHPAFNMLTQVDFLSLTDILDFAASLNIDVYPEVRTSQDGITFGAWQKYVAGAYTGMVFDARMQLKTYDPTVQAILSGFTFAVDVPDRDDHYVNQAIAAGGTTINFTPDGGSTAIPFNGGPQGSPTRPSVQVTILNAVQGDDVVISGLSLSGATIQVLNGGSGVARNVNILAQGY